MDSLTKIDTSAFPKAERLLQWSKAMAVIYGPLLVECDNPEAFSARMAHIGLWRLTLCRTEASRHRIALTQQLARPGTHPLMKVHFQTAGAIRFEQDGRRIDVHPGECLVFNVSRPHTIATKGQTRHDALILPNELIRHQTVPVETLRAHKIATSALAGFAHSIVDTYLSAPINMPRSAQARLAEALMSLLRAALAEGSIGDEGFSSSAILRWRARNFIEDHLEDSDLDIAAIATALGCSKRYLHKIFRDEGRTVQDLIWDTRLERSMEQLSSPAGQGISITDIAFAWGFSSSSHFSRLFRNKFGAAPSSMRWRG